MSVTLFMRNSARVNAFAGAAPNVSPNVKYVFPFSTEPECLYTPQVNLRGLLRTM